MADAAADILFLNMKHAGNARRVLADAQISIEEQRSHVGAFQEVLHVGIQLAQFGDLPLKFGVYRVEFFVDRVEFLIRALQFFVGSDQLFVCRLQFFIARLNFFDRGLQRFACVEKLTLERCQTFLRCLRGRDVANKGVACT